MFLLTTVATYFNMDYCPYFNDSKDDENDKNVHTQVIRKREREVGGKGEGGINIKAMIMPAPDIT
jgi:hypothetical protein